MSVVDREWLLNGLRKAVSRLASDSSAQLEWLQGGRVHPDELALEFDQFHKSVLDNFSSEFGEAALRQLSALDEHLIRMSGSENAALWSDVGIRDAQEWAQVRELAAAALAAGGWAKV
jgi:hypothetical protein